MPVLINFKICDNAKECNGIAVCPTGAISWDDAKKAIVIDNSKCTSCGKCVPACMVDAIRVAKTDAEYKKIKKEFAADKRKASDLFIDRYGAMSTHPAFLIGEDKFGLEVEGSHKLTAAEIFNDSSIMCLLFSIPVKELFGKTEVKYRKVRLDGDALLKKYRISKLPSLLFFRDGRLVGKVEGYYDVKGKKELIGRIRKITSP
jgi:NAD-dependent dihydropyrimidine dehydrogenase PreA subunit